MQSQTDSLRTRFLAGVSNLNSQIFWRITAGVFVSILIIEILLLAYSWFTERQRLLQRVDESLVTVTSVLDFSNPIPQLDRMLQRNQITGYRYLSSDGDVVMGGDGGRIVHTALSAENPFNYQSETGSYYRYYAGESDNGKVEQLWLSVDILWLGEYMTNYVWRIIVMTMLISLFVTGACLVYLKPILVNPLLRLNQLLINGEKSGIKTARAESRDLQRTDEIGSVFRSLDNLRDDLLSAEEKNLLMSERFKQFADLGADCFWEVDSRLVFNYVAGDTQRLIALSGDAIVGRSLHELSGIQENRATDAGEIYQALKEEGVWEGQVVVSSEDSPLITVRIASVPVRNESNRITGFRGTIVDISKESELATRLHFQASHDSLTGLTNRREFDHQLQISFDQYEQNGEEFSLLILDLDQFKQVNDTDGHLAGDRLLKKVAKSLTTSVAPEDIVARIGGDEFAIILRSKSGKELGVVAEEIRSAVENRFARNHKSHNVSASVGIVQIAPEFGNVESLQFAADSCCIKAKKHGKNQVIVYSKDDPTLNSHRDEGLWISRITTALEDDQFSLFRQSIVRIDQHLPMEEHFEILLRMKNTEEGGFWPPNLFLPVAERNRLMPKIDRWVVTHALKWLEDQDIPNGVDYCMNINLSADSLSEPSFREFLINRVRSNLKLNRYVCFEVTESAAMTNYDDTIALLVQLRECGCSVALDDFGTGFSSLAYIKDLPLDYIKIDGSFIQKINSSELDQTVVKSVAKIAKVLKIKTVAEFVDTEEAVRLLAELKIDYAQGFLFSKPEELGSHSQDVQSRAA